MDVKISKIDGRKVANQKKSRLKISQTGLKG